MSDKLNFDSLDILAASLGVIAAFAILPVPGDRATERITVVILVFLAVAVKRKFVPTLSPNPSSSALARLSFLLIALVGACLLGLVFIDTVFNVGAFPNASPRNYAALIGIVLLVMATFIDRRYLKQKMRAR